MVDILEKNFKPLYESIMQIYSIIKYFESLMGNEGLVVQDTNQA